MVTTNPSNNWLQRLFSRSYVLNWEVVVIVALLTAAVFTRFYDLGSRVMSHDESLHTRYSYNLAEDGDFVHTPLMHGPILFHVTAFFYTLFGDNDFTSRIYAAGLSVLLVMSPFLFRRWLGRWGAILAALMLLISPIIMYYGRYIRHDTPSILSAVLMIWAMMNYIGGAESQRRRSHWLYIIAVSMIWNLGSKETSFIYIAIVGVFLVLFFLARLMQHFGRIPGKPIFYIGMIGFFLGAVMSLGMYIVLDIVQFEMLSPSVGASFWELSSAQQGTFLLWTGIVIGSVILAMLGTVVWAFRDRIVQIPWGEFLAILGIALIVCTTFVVFEEISHVEKVVETAVPADPDATGEIVSTSSLNWTPMVLVWAVATAGFVFVFVTRRQDNFNGSDEKDKYGRGFWGTLDIFPEADLIIVIGTLILPWATAFVPYLMRGSAADYAALADSLPPEIFQFFATYIPVIGTASQIGQFLLNLMAFVPLFALAWAVGLMWDWRRWLITSLIFHALFVFFFTTIFTNIAGLGTGMVYSLGYWLEQQGERRGSQPQYYYLLIIMPFYEFLPVIGGISSMFAGLTVFWNWRKKDNRARVALLEHERDAILNENADYEESDTEFHSVGELLQASQDFEDEAIVDETSQGDYRERIDLSGLSQSEIDKLIAKRYREKLFGSVFYWIFAAIVVLGLLTFFLSGFQYLFFPSGILMGFFALYSLRLRGQAKREIMEAGYYEASQGQRGEGFTNSDTTTISLERNDAYLDGIPFLIFFSWLALLNLVGYSLAGEKMPWLGTHLSLPLIFLSAWFFGGIIARLDFQKFVKQGWLIAVVLVVFFIGLFHSLSPLLMGTRPFAGLGQDQLMLTYGWIAAVLVTGGALSAIFYLMEQVGWKHVSRLASIILFGLLSFVTLRSALLASFVNYDYATEFLVYAHAAPAVKTVLSTIEDISLRTTDGYDLQIAYDNEVSWPYSWYFRNFNNVTYVGENPTRQNLQNAEVVVVGAANRSKVEPILEDRYIRFDYIRLWWPMQEYFYLTPDRFNNLVDLGNANSAQMRQGIFDIWWNRDYTTYGLATNKDFSVTNWPVSDRMHFYVRRDIAAQIWSYGVGEGTVTNPLNDASVNQCTANWQDLTALSSFESPNALVNPIGIDVSDDGLVYVAEEFGHRISVFDTNGNFIRTLGQEGNLPSVDGQLYFVRPNSVAVASDGSLFIADTWNYRIQYLSTDYSPITAWGQAGSFGFDAPIQPVDAFWGPRSVAVSADNRVYVADTGNKRVRAYQVADGVATYLYDIGSGGSGLGQLDEPSGLVVHPDGRLFVADTWNRRISVFSTEGVFLQTIPVRGWYEEQGNRPYLAIDANRELLYVTDPDAGRVLVYTTNGDCLGSFGQAAGTEPTLGQFGVASGIAVDNDGFVYVSDTRLGRILKFVPFPYTAPVSSNGEEVQPEASQEILVPSILLPESSQESILPESTQASE